MKAKQFSLIFLSVFACLQTGQGQNWTLTAAPVKNWSAVASSADGSKLAAVVNNGGIYVSTNSGADWFLSGAPTRNWYAIAASSNGSNLVASTRYGIADGIYTSTNLGTTWSYRTNLLNILSVASSTNGQNLLAAAWGPGYAYTSTNAGLTWQRTSSPQGYWTSSASSADGGKLVIGQGGSAYGSTNSGLNWTKINQNPADTSANVGVGSSGDGQVLAYVVNGGILGGGTYFSTNAGSTWQSNIVSNVGLSSVVISIDGSKIAALDSGLNYFSSNAGQSWVSNNIGVALKYIAASADGSRLVAAVPFGNIYVAQKPTLNMKLTTGTATISWPSLAVGWNLKSATDLYGTNWNSPSENLQDNGVNKFIVVNVTNDNRFYRLSNP